MCGSLEQGVFTIHIGGSPFHLSTCCPPTYFQKQFHRWPLSISCSDLAPVEIHSIPVHDHPVLDSSIFYGVIFVAEDYFPAAHIFCRRLSRNGCGMQGRRQPAALRVILAVELARSWCTLFTESTAQRRRCSSVAARGLPMTFARTPFCATHIYLSDSS